MNALTDFDVQADGRQLDGGRLDGALHSLRKVPLCVGDDLGRYRHRCGRADGGSSLLDISGTIPAEYLATGAACGWPADGDCQHPGQCLFRRWRNVEHGIRQHDFVVGFGCRRRGSLVVDATALVDRGIRSRTICYVAWTWRQLMMASRRCVRAIGQPMPSGTGRNRQGSTPPSRVSQAREGFGRDSMANEERCMRLLSPAPNEAVWSVWRSMILADSGSTDLKPYRDRQEDLVSPDISAGQFIGNAVRHRRATFCVLHARGEGCIC